MRMKTLSLYIAVCALLGCGGTQTKVAPSAVSAATPRAKTVRETPRPVKARPPQRLTQWRGQVRTGEAKDSVVLYGSDMCGICVHVRRQLERDKVPYRFMNVRVDRVAQRTMWALVRSVQPHSRSVRFPVVTVGDQILVSPGYGLIHATWRAAK